MAGAFVPPARRRPDLRDLRSLADQSAHRPPISGAAAHPEARGLASPPVIHRAEALQTDDDAYNLGRERPRILDLDDREHGQQYIQRSHRKARKRPRRTPTEAFSPRAIRGIANITR